MSVKLKTIITNILILLIVIFVFSCKKQSIDSFTDQRDGKIYKMVEIGEQVWMAENLAYLPMVSPVKTDGGIWVYGYDGTDVQAAMKTLNYQEFGCLYDWAAAMDIDRKYNFDSFNGSDLNHQGICPDGWYLPSDEEWSLLENYLETDPDFISTEERRHTGDVGAKIKSVNGWNNNGNGNNESGFNAVGTGFRYRTGYFFNKGSYTYFWSSTEVYNKSAYYRYLRDSTDGTYRGIPSKGNGMSVRCIKKSA